jgi:hypothetical protein
MNVEDLKAANPEFFTPVVSNFLGDDRLWVAREGGASVLHIVSMHGSHAVYSIAPTTLKLEYMRHE